MLIASLQNIENKTIKLKANIYAYDINKTLIHLYKNIQFNLNKVISEIKKIIMNQSYIISK